MRPGLELGFPSPMIWVQIGSTIVKKKDGFSNKSDLVKDQSPDLALFPSWATMGHLKSSADICFIEIIQSNSLHPSSIPILDQWEFQDPKMEVLYHIRPYFLGIFPYIGLT